MRGRERVRERLPSSRVTYFEDTFGILEFSIIVLFFFLFFFRRKYKNIAKTHLTGTRKRGRLSLTPSHPGEGSLLAWFFSAPGIGNSRERIKR
jgi:hypothetical protein